MRKIFLLVVSIGVGFANPVYAEATEDETIACAKAVLQFDIAKLTAQSDIIKRHNANPYLVSEADVFSAEVDLRKKFLETEKICGGNYNLSQTSSWLWKQNLRRSPVINTKLF